MVAAESHPSGPRLLILGAPGSGKGTQAELLSARLGIPAISTGEMLRESVDEGTELGREVEDLLTSGKLVDDETMAEIVRHRLAAEDAAEGWLLDGYPRTLVQARDLDRVLEEAGAKLDTAIAIDVPEDELVRRALARQRADDREEIIRKRIELYRQKTEPLLGYYSERDLLQVVDGDREIDEVGESILALLSVEA